ncbi:MAG TPA: TIR domain-containing protein [Vitreimonas sp.]|jgi:uncharacterized membrane protein YhaH (DUF805 family)|nr:TIR domain-containing protein [Vitreimonas sp.]
MPDVFISYAREDRGRAEQVAQGLAQLGLDAFWDTDIPPGQTWADYIEAKLAQCKAVVVLWSEHSTKSQWVREEARLGRDKARLIPARLDGATPPFGFGEVQAADLGAWRGQSNHPEWMRFSQAVFAAVRGVDAPMPQIQQTQWQAPPQQQQFVQQSNWPSQNAPAPADNPVALVQHSLRMYVNGKGRARRKELAWFIVLYLIVASVGYFADWQEGFDPVTGQINSYLFRVLVWLIFICPFVSLMSRRSHDIGQSGWVAALAPIPFVGAILALVFAFIPGQPGDNQYGPDPKAVRG